MVLKLTTFVSFSHLHDQCATHLTALFNNGYSGPNCGCKLGTTCIEEKIFKIFACIILSYLEFIKLLRTVFRHSLQTLCCLPLDRILMLKIVTNPKPNFSRHLANVVCLICNKTVFLISTDVQ